MKIKSWKLRSAVQKKNQLATGTPYRTSQSVGKALKRALVSLPSSPRKKRGVIENLAKRVGLEIVNSSKC